MALATVLVGCAPRAFKPLEFSPAVRLQDPMPGLAIVYLLRAPHDGATISVYLNDDLVATMPPGSYTAVSIKPGIYFVAATSANENTQPGSPDNPILTVSAGERRFLYTAVPSKSSSSMSLFIVRKAITPLIAPTVVYGQRTWSECNELDAQGLMSIGRVVLPEHGF